MQALLDELAKISLDCDNCDEAALNAALAQVAAINAQLTNLINDFNDEMTEINNRFNNFVARLQAVINIHSTTVPGIMAECGVNARTARRMSRIRLRVIEQVNNLINYKNTLDQRVTDISFGTHDCVKADLDMDKLASLVCAVPQ
jgi:methyl-accepting chemotaxis protein